MKSKLIGAFLLAFIGLGTVSASAKDNYFRGHGRGYRHEGGREYRGGGYRHGNYGGGHCGNSYYRGHNNYGGHAGFGRCR